MPQETLKELGAELGISREKVRRIKNRASAKLSERREVGFRVAPSDHEARQFREEYLACNGKFKSLPPRKLYVKPTRQLLPFKERTCAGRTLSEDEVRAFVASRPDLGGRQ